MSLKLQFFGGLAMMGAAGVFMAIDAGDKAMNYVEVNARVSEVVDEDCWIQLGDETWRPKPGVEVTCAEVVDVIKLDTRKEAKLKGKKNLEVRYISPVDNAEHRSTLTLTDGHAGFAEVDDGGVVLILANTGDADKVRPL